MRARVTDARRRADEAKRRARERAVSLYTASAVPIGFVFDSSDALEAARRQNLVARVNALDDATLAELSASASDLADAQARLESQLREQSQLLARLRSEQAALDSQLAAARQAYAREQQAKAAAARARAATRHPRAPAASATATTAPPRAEPPAPPAPAGPNPHHDDPFLVCTRTRESHGNYAAVNRGGYYGAYQFAPRTWNVTASHAGRPDLIGVRPDHASAYDQDELAWQLYQWRGKGPWLGLC